MSRSAGRRGLGSGFRERWGLQTHAQSASIQNTPQHTLAMLGRWETTTEMGLSTINRPLQHSKYQSMQPASLPHGPNVRSSVEGPRSGIEPSMTAVWGLPDAAVKPA